MQYRPEIDGLRAFAIVPVVLFHAGIPFFNGGFIGVDIFFVISGYLISTIIIKEKNNENFKLTSFYIRRIRRIIPALFLVLIFSIPLSFLLLMPNDLKDFGQSLISTLFFSSNILFLFEQNYFASEADLKPLLHTWSLSVEEQYYLIFPIFLILFWKFGLKVILIVLSLIFIFSLIYSEIYFYSETQNFYLLHTRAWEILLGVFAAFIIYGKDFPKSLFLNNFLSILGISLIIVSIILFDKDTRTPSIYTLIPNLGAFLIILAAKNGTFVQRILSYKFLVSIGLISYSLYLWHHPLLAFSKYRFDDSLNFFYVFIIIALSIGMAYLSWKYLERPFRNPNMINNKRLFLFSGFFAFVILSFGIYFHISDGELERFNGKDKKIVTSLSEGPTYVEQNLSKIILKNFEKNNKKKILLIGDSHAEDLLNSLVESKLSNSLNITGYRIPNSCGVLMIEFEKLRTFSSENCKSQPNFFNSEQLINLMIEADQIWLISNWREWQLPFLKQSIKNIKEINSSLIFFGKKDFGDINAREFMNGGLMSWTESIPISVEANKINKFLRTNIPEETIFIDIVKLFCGNEKKCNNYDGTGVFSFDGDHLTRYGALTLGNKIKNDDKVSNILIK